MHTLKFIVLLAILIPSPLTVWTQARFGSDNRFSDRTRNFESFVRAEMAAGVARVGAVHERKRPNDDEHQDHEEDSHTRMIGTLADKFKSG